MAKNDPWVSLHTHTSYSMLDGAAKTPELVAAAVEQGMPGLATTDHGNMYAAFEYYNACKAAGLNYIPGMEAYIAPGSRFEKSLPEGERKKTDKYSHMTLLAVTTEGYHNLVKISSRASLEGFFYHPRADRELLAEYAEGIVATTGCVGGEVAQLIYRGKYEEAKRVAGEFAEIFGKGNFYVELMKHGIEIEEATYPGLIRIAKELNLPLLATNDLHYTKKEDSVAHDALLCIQTGATIEQEKRFRFEGSEFYLKSAQEMRELFSDHPEAVDNTLVICERADVTIESGKQLLPAFPVPEGHTSETYLRERVEIGLQKRYKGEVPEEVRKQAEYETGVINAMGFNDYFLIVEDLIAHAKEVGIRVGPGRGCLSVDSKVLTPRGPRPIAEVAKGDLVFDETGAQVVVTDTFEYDCDEPLVEIKAFYGGAGNKMTADHKVLVSKPVRVTNRHLLAQGYRFETEIPEPTWIRADEVEVGDLVVTPKLQFEETLTGFTIGNPVYERGANVPHQHSSKALALATGYSRCSVKRALNGFSSPQGKCYKAVSSILEAAGTTVAAVRASQTLVTEVSSFVPADERMGYLLGLFISDGWIRSNGRASVGFAVRRSEDDGTIPRLVQELFGIQPVVVDHKEKDLRQYTINHRGVYELFRDLVPEYKFTAKTKYIPPSLFNGSEGFRRALLDGLWAGDGTYKERTKYTTTSERLAHDVAMLLGTLGLPAGVKRAQRRPETREEYAGACGIEYSVLSSRSFGEIKRQCGVSFDGKYVYYRVRSVETVAPEGKVYDFTVPTTHSYVTDSFVVHNSAPGSMLAYALGITALDPLEHGLIFERFLNPERISMPDIDIDFDDRRRPEMIEYSVQKYGYDNVAQIVTYGTIKAKAALKDAARVLGFPYATGDKLTKAMPAMVMGADMPLKDCFDPKAPRYGEAGEIRELYKNDPEAKTVIDTALGLEGLKRQVGVHAAGVIISDQPLIENIPVWRRDADGAVVTQYDMGTCETIGLLKMDFLGLRNLTIISDALDGIKQNKGIDLDIESVPLDDPATYKLLQEAETVGVFQLESTPMRNLMRSLKPTDFADISALIALYRPGPMGVNAHNDYADRKNGRKPIEPIHPELEEPLREILADAQGLVIFQEAVMAAAQKLAGYTLGQADLLRRAMGKKKKEILDKEYVPFREGMRKNGYSDEAVKAIWEVLVPFSGYAFNKAHSAAYGMVSYWTAYLKANHPVEYMAALLTSVSGDKDKTAIFLTECRKMGIKVLPPDVNVSTMGYTPAGKDIRFGLSAVRSVGDPVVEAIVSARTEKGEFTSFEDYVRKVDAAGCKKNTVDSLIKAGAFDSLGHTRRGLSLVYEQVIASGAKSKKAEAAGQFDLFSALEDYAPPAVEIPEGEWDQKTILSFEREMLGLYVSAHPLDGVDLSHEDPTPIPHLSSEELPDRSEVKIAGIISSVEHKLSKQGKPWAATVIEDLTGSVEVMFFSRSYLACKEQLVPDAIVVVTGQLDKREEGDVKVLAAGVRPVRAAPEKGFDSTEHSEMIVQLTTDQLSPNLVAAIKQTLGEHAGELPVVVATPNGKRFPVPLQVDGRLPLRMKLRELDGVGDITFTT